MEFKPFGGYKLSLRGSQEGVYPAKGHVHQENVKKTY